MALKILEGCINCDMCEPECPNTAISMGEKVYEINPDLCTECVGFYDNPTCISVCPIDVIITDPDRVEDKDTLYQKFQKLVHEDKI
ncbi:YfhL family 4Fe-4S dicluster ferredoxin [Thiomicrorhabdus sediminis]|uniref:YfhL family 4Fe-4S dicluster ferredoxin n=1 Tax=Thiomicrorhabdus sediminis TaxID=2580412 RepID=A0A4P9K765_9GAMM|nr:YfhL family 4Fe-4S dicluster ferredoxin [Thiomicrorhabdus sediminis]QCU90087.1 YfhL family 4Fe-4S dicluster ferredoxin [Thiomicrorhabdus sediminis]